MTTTHSEPLHRRRLSSRYGETAGEKQRWIVIAIGTVVLLAAAFVVAFSI